MLPHVIKQEEYHLQNIERLKELLKESLTLDKNKAEQLGEELAHKISNLGGKKILEDIRKAL